MGLLAEGHPLEWKDSLKYIDYVKKHGVEQFLHVLRDCMKRQYPDFLWGDEVEYIIVKLPKDGGPARLSLRTKEVIEAAKKDMSAKNMFYMCRCRILPEYGSYHIEATPALPYSNRVLDLARVECNMRTRRAFLKSFLEEDEALITMGNFPRLGVDEFTFPSFPNNGDVANSDYVPDEIINHHPRFATLTRNIRLRRGKRVRIEVPIFKDENTKKTSPIHMDAMAFGMGCSCLQVTFQARNLDEARHLYDQLAILTPLFMALTAGTPFYKGYVSDWDARWNVISQSVDDRKPYEKGHFEADDLPNIKAGDMVDYQEGATYKGILSGPVHKFQHAKVVRKDATNIVVDPEAGDETTLVFADSLDRIYPLGVKTDPKYQPFPKSRYATISTFLSRPRKSTSFRKEYNDIYCPKDQYTYNRLIEEGVDEAMACHISHLFIRDPLVIYRERVENVDDVKSTEHFENIQSTNWQNVRFKPPTPASDIGFRVEFRTMEVQLDDQQNAAFVVFITLLSRAILYYDLDLYMPLSKIDANMMIAHKRDAVRTQKFHFRKSFRKGAVLNAIGKMTLKDIISGNEYRLGLAGIVRQYLNEMCPNGETLEKVEGYIKHVEGTASGEVPTNARKLRGYVNNHPLYKKDSVISDELNTEMIKFIVAQGEGVDGLSQACGKGRFPQNPTLKLKTQNGNKSPRRSVRGRGKLKLTDQNSG